MGSSITQYVPLRDVVNLYLESAKKNDSDFLRMWRLAFRGFIQMGFNAFWQVKTIKLVLLPNQTAKFPNDYMQWIRVGVVNSSGELQILNINNSLTTLADTSNQRLSKIASQIGAVGNDLLSTDLSIGDLMTDGSYSADADYGAGSKLLTAGTCRVDEANNCIIFDVNFAYKEVVFEYISSPEADMDYEIPIQFQEAMIAWLAWQDVQNTAPIFKGSAAGRQNAAMNFKNQLTLAKKMFKPFRLQEVELYFRESQRYAVKG